MPATDAQGVIVALGGRYGGFTLFVKDGVLVYENNTFGQTKEEIRTKTPLKPGKATISFEFIPDPGSGPSGPLHRLLAGPGQGRLLVNGEEVGAAKFSKFGGFESSINETFDLGRDTGSTVSDEYKGPFVFNGKVKQLTIDLVDVKSLTPSSSLAKAN